MEKGANMFHTLLVMPFRHLQDLNGEACKERQAMLQAQNLRQIKGTLDPSAQNKDIEYLVKDGGSFMWRKWAKPILQSWTKLLRKCHILRAFFLTSSLYRVLPSPLPLEAMLLCVLKQP